MRNISLLIILLLLLPKTIWAAETNILRIQGLSFQCEECAKVDDEHCEFIYEETKAVSLCNELVPVFLSQLFKTGYDGQNPHPKDLISFLLKEENNQESFFLALNLLIKNETGREYLSRNASEILEKHGSLLIKQTYNNKVTVEFLKDIGRLLLTGSTEINDSLRALIAYREDSLENLVNELTVVDLERDEEMLEHFIKVLPSNKPLWIEELRLLKNFISSRGITSEQSEFSFVNKYIDRIEMQLMTSIAADSALDGSERLSAISKSNFRDYRTPKTHQVIHEIVFGLHKLPAEKLRELIKPYNISDMLFFFSEYDTEIAHALALLYNKLSKDALLNNQLALALSYLNKSYEAKKRDMPVRQALLVDLFNELEKVDNEILYQQFVNIVGVSFIQEIESSRFKSRLFKWGGISLLFIIASYFCVVRYGKAVQEKEEAELITLSMNERLELRTIQKYFGLPMWSDVDDLKHKFRGRVKEIHPDTGNGSVNDFSQMVQMARRGEELLAKL